MDEQSKRITKHLPIQSLSVIGEVFCLSIEESKQCKAGGSSTVTRTITL